MKIKEINQMGKELKDLLKLKNPPVAVALVPDTHELPEGINKIEEKMRHCEMVDKVRKKGSEFYALVDDQQCKGGAAVMGLQEMAPKLANGDVYYNLNRYKTINSARRTMQQVPRLKAGSTKAVLYGPLDKVSFIPDVVLIIDTPKKAMQLSQALLHRFGGRVNASFAGIQSLCADGVVQPYKDGHISASLGCGGSRKYANVAEDEMIIGIPVERLHDMIEAAHEMFG